MEVVIGYDINEYYAQISYATKGEEPVTLQFPGRKENGNIETALCKREGVNQWYCGKEAVKRGVAGEGVLIENLWRLLKNKETVVIEKKEYAIETLCNLFLSRTLAWAVQNLEENLKEPVVVKAVVITAEPWDDTMREMTKELTKNVLSGCDLISMQSHEESLYYFLVHQDQRLLGYETCVFDLTGETLTSYCAMMNHKTKPIVTTVEKEEVPQIEKKRHYASIMEHDRKLEELDIKLKDYLLSFFEGRIVTTLYLIGEGFQGDWYKESLKILCRNRKVFAGNNLFGKGACYSAAEKIWPGEISEKFLYFGKDMLRYNVGICVWEKEEQKYLPLLDAGTKWYEAKSQTQFMMREAKTIELLITPIDGAGQYTEILQLPIMPEREFMSFCMTLETTMSSKRNLSVCIRDEGFGEIFEKLPIDITYDLVLGEKGKR